MTRAVWGDGLTGMVGTLVEDVHEVALSVTAAAKTRVVNQAHVSAGAGRSTSSEIERWAKVSSTALRATVLAEHGLEGLRSDEPAVELRSALSQGILEDSCSGPAPNPSTDKENPATLTRPTIAP